MAKLNKKISLKNVYIDPDKPMTLQEIGKEETLCYNLEKIALEFADKYGVSITFSWDDELPPESEGADEGGDEY